LIPTFINIPNLIQNHLLPNDCSVDSYRQSLKTFLLRDASAERGNATVSRPSVRLPVHDV